VYNAYTMIAAQPKKGNTRKTGKEQYYTIPATANFCVDKIKNYINKDSLILEPCGGRGDFIRAVQAAGFDNEIISCDIEPKDPKVVKANFLEDAPFREEFANCKHLVTVTNPPFGRANSLSVKFFNEAAQYSDVIGFIIPKAWKKWSVINRLNNRFHLVEEFEMPKVCFYSEEKGAYENKNLNTLFQIWKKEDRIRSKISVPDHKLISRVKPKDADVVLVTFGWSCGKVIEKFERTKNTCYSYFKINNTDEDIPGALREIDFSIFYNNVSYTQCLGMQEINWCLNEFYGLSNLTDVDPIYLPEKLLLNKEIK
jgi:predicted RNA methylase